MLLRLRTGAPLISPFPDKLSDIADTYRLQESPIENCIATQAAVALAAIVVLGRAEASVSTHVPARKKVNLRL